MGKKNKMKECEAFKIAVCRLRRHKHARMPRGYKKDPKEYEEKKLTDV